MGLRVHALSPICMQSLQSSTAAGTFRLANSGMGLSASLKMLRGSLGSSRLSRRRSLCGTSA